LVSRSNIKQQITKPGDIKVKKKVIKKNMGGGLSPNKAKELNNIMNASQGIAENLQKQTMVNRKRGGIVNGNDLVSSYYEGVK
jgi:hypothetical protein|tara:strand:- start:194 stop:442 length:249 start_codon:yes stop_codon:yes gene_type:complete